MGEDVGRRICVLVGGQGHDRRRLPADSRPHRDRAHGHRDRQVPPEAVTDYDSLYLGLRMGTLKQFQKMSAVESVCSSAVKATIDSGCPLIVVLTETGHTAIAIAKYRPKAPILAISASETSIRQLLVVRGVTPMLTASFVGTDSVISKALDKAKADGMVKSGDCVVAVHGQREECPGHSNLMKMVVVP